MHHSPPPARIEFTVQQLDDGLANIVFTVIPITEAGAGPEHRRAITFVGVDNEPSLRGCYSAGFQVYIERIDSWRLGRRRVRWIPATTPPTPPAAGTG